MCLVFPLSALYTVLPVIRSAFVFFFCFRLFCFVFSILCVDVVCVCVCVSSVLVFPPFCSFLLCSVLFCSVLFCRVRFASALIFSFPFLSFFSFFSFSLTLHHTSRDSLYCFRVSAYFHCPTLLRALFLIYILPIYISLWLCTCIHV